ncbi:polysaccharide lyase 6 family protein [Haloferula sp.]|uniref:polysaccharide lyase 6 family protein n=1 Tax=Haloferula sp. TaxID=2497595 RepID=UPI00329FAEC0
MKHRLTLAIAFAMAIQCIQGATHTVKSAEEVEAVIESGNLAAGDTIVWTAGEYSDEELNIRGVHGTKEGPITLRASKPGGVVLGGESKFNIGADWWEIEGFHFDGSDGKTNSYNSVQFRGSGGDAANHSKLKSCAMTNLNAEDESSKWVQIYGRSNTIERCHFSGKKSKGALITVELGYLGDAEKAGHRIALNYFADFAPQEGTDNEVIRVGYSGDQNKPATCVIERNYFYRCDGEVEIISNKSSYNTYRSNTFRRCNGSLVLRHGHHARVEGNFFFGDGAEDVGGIRIIDSHHIVVNNYMQDLSGKTWNAALSILGGKKPSGGSDNGYQAVDGICVAHNSIINCQRSIFLNKAKGSRAPTGLIANNLIVSQSGPLVVDELSADKLEWKGNLMHGAPVGGIKPAITTDPGMERWEGRLRPGSVGPVVDAAVKIELIVGDDITGRERPEVGLDIGADEVHGPSGDAMLAPLEPADVGVKFLLIDRADGI